MIASEPGLSLEYGKRIIDSIVERTQDKNIDKNSDKFKKYDADYVKSTIFDIYGKEKNDVNLTLTGQMLASMDVRMKKAGMPEIFFLNKKREEIAGYHIDGTPIMPRRDFFGVSKEEQISIFKKLVREFNDLDQDLLNTDARRVADQSISIEEPDDES